MELPNVQSFRHYLGEVTKKAFFMENPTQLEPVLPTQPGWTYPQIKPVERVNDMCR